MKVQPTMTPHRVDRPDFRLGDRVAWVGDLPLGHPDCPLGKLRKINEFRAIVDWDAPHEPEDRVVVDPYHDGYFIKVES